MLHWIDNMKEYLVVHQYDNTGYGVYVTSEKELASYLASFEGRKNFAFEIDGDLPAKLKTILKEVEIKIIEKQYDI